MDNGQDMGNERPSPGVANSGITKRVELAVLIAIVLVAVLLRLWRLDRIPPGLTHDEADTGYFVAAVYRGAPSQVETPYGYANEPFTMYSGALFMALLGPTDLALRVHSGFFGLVLLLFAYSWARRAFGVPVALGSAALVATSYWALSNSRFALNSEPAPALFAGAVFFLWVALYGDTTSRKQWWAWGLFALFLTGSLYAYEAARAAAGAIVVFFFYLALLDRERFRRHGLWFAAALITVGVLAAPHLLDPASWQRSSTLSGPLEAAMGGELGPLWASVKSALGTFSIKGDSFVTYNLPGRPIFDPVVSVFFIGGIALCVRFWRKPNYAFLLLWTVAGVTPTLILGEWTSTLHSKGAEAAILIVPAVCAVALGDYIRRHLGLRWTRLFAAACVAWLFVVAAFTWRDYFHRWGQAPETRAAYFHNLVAITDYVDQLPADTAVSLSSPFPDLPLDPFIADMRIQRDDLSLAWFDARRALLLPSAQKSILILPTNTPLDQELVDWVPVSSAERMMVHPDDVDPYFDVLRLRPDEMWDAITSQLKGQAIAAPNALALPVNLGDAVELVGYEVVQPVASPSEMVTVITAWRVLDPAALGPELPQHYGRGARIFVHLIDGTGQLVSQEDRLDAPAWNWRPGDRFVQIHRVAIDPTSASGSYRLALGMYVGPDQARLPVLSRGEPVADHVVLQSIEVRAP
jgi:hypothetical protein